MWVERLVGFASAYGFASFFFGFSLLEQMVDNSFLYLAIPVLMLS